MPGHGSLSELRKLECLFGSRRPPGDGACGGPSPGGRRLPSKVRLSPLRTSKCKANPLLLSHNLPAPDYARCNRLSAPNFPLVEVDDRKNFPATRFCVASSAISSNRRWLEKRREYQESSTGDGHDLALGDLDGKTICSVRCNAGWPLRYPHLLLDDTIGSILSVRCRP